MKNLTLTFRILVAIVVAAVFVAGVSYVVLGKLAEDEMISLAVQSLIQDTSRVPQRANRDEIKKMGIEGVLFDVFERNPLSQEQGFVTGEKLIYVKKSEPGYFNYWTREAGFASFLKNQLPLFGAFVFVMTLITSIVVFLLAKSALEPLAALRRTTEDILAGRFEVRMRYTAADELGRTFQALKRLCAELETKEKDLEKVSELARKDGLTGLSNHRTFKEEFHRLLNQAQQTKTPVGLLIMDVDHFKKFNDTYGHQQGDEVLRTVGATLKGTAGAESLTARYGGEEFVVVASKVNRDDFKALGEKLRKAIESSKVKSLAKAGESLGVTASFGGLFIEGSAIQTPPDQAIDLQYFVEICDQNLYQAKRGGRNRVVMTRLENLT